MDRAYGQYKSNGESKDGKAGGTAYIIKKPVVDKLWEDHPYDYSYNHEISKEKRYVDQTIGKMENELKIRAMRKFKVTV